MPELPEVETVRLGLSTLLPSKRIANVTHDWLWTPSELSSPGSASSESGPNAPSVRWRTYGYASSQKTHFATDSGNSDQEETAQMVSKSFPNAAADVERFLIGATIVRVRRRAKVLLIDLNTDYTLVIHLKMTGQLVFVGEQRFGAGHPNDSLVNELPDKSTRVTFGFTDGSQLYFNDQRKFGWVRLLPTVEVPNIDFFQKVGPEPLESMFTWQAFRERLQRRKNSNIKAVLLDQTVVAGIGNIYADESLWGAKIHPTMLVRDLSDVQVKLLFTELQYVLKLAIEKGGSSNHTYVNAEGKKGSYMDFARVFRREKLPCPRCGTTIVKTKVAGRGTHTCPTCQTLSVKQGDTK